MDMMPQRRRLPTEPGGDISGESGAGNDLLQLLMQHFPGILGGAGGGMGGGILGMGMDLLRRKLQPAPKVPAQE